VYLLYTQDREEQYYWVLKAQQKVWPGLPDVHIWDYSR
jgi:glutamyl-tRNA synthetase